MSSFLDIPRLLDVITAQLYAVEQKLTTLQKQITSLTNLVTLQGVKEMATEQEVLNAISQLQADVTANGNAIQNAIALIQQQQASGNISAADADAIVNQLQQAHSSLSASTQSLVAAVPTPNPTPNP